MKIENNEKNWKLAELEVDVMEQWVKEIKRGMGVKDRNKNENRN